MKQLIAVLFAFLLPVGYAQQTAPSYNDLEELAARVIGFGYDTPDMIVGKLPSAAQAGFDVAVPEGSKVFGYISSFGRLEVVLDIRATPEAIFAFFKSKMTGFTESGSALSGQRSGFSFSSNANQGTNPDVQDQLFCSGPKSVNVAIFRVQSAIKDVRLRIDNYTCGFNLRFAFPLLLLPAGAQPFSGLSSSDTSSIAFRNVSVDTAFGLYKLQLEAANWKMEEVVKIKTVTLAVFSKDKQQIAFSIFSRPDGVVVAMMQVLAL